MFRAYYALPPLNNSNGQPTGAILGVINMLKKLISSYNPAYMAVVFDSKKPTFRHQLFAEYKLNRAKMPEDLASQLPFLFEIISSLGLHLIQIPGIEADDIIGTLATKAKKLQLFSIIATGDKDLAQLVDEDIIIVNTMTDLILDPAGVIDKFKVPASSMVDYLVLTGDQVDNIPGVANVGPKTAVKWLLEYKNLAGIINNLDKIKGKVGENLRAAIPNFSLYTKLVTIDKDIEITFDFKDFTIKPKDNLKLKALFEQLQINSWLKDIPNLTIKDKDKDKDKDKEHTLAKIKIINLEQTVNAEELLAYWVKIITVTEMFAIYITTTSLDPLQAELTGIYLATPTDNIYLQSARFKSLLLPNLVDPLQNPKDCLIKSQLNNLIKLLQDPNKTKVTYDLKYLAHVLDNYAIKMDASFFDVMLAKYVVNSIDPNKIDPATLNAVDILQLYHTFSAPLQQSEKLNFVFNNIELPLAIVLKNMERIGVLIDVVKLGKQAENLSVQLKQLEQTAYSSAKQEFNLNSPKQLQEILYNQLDLPVLATTPKGQPSTAEEVLQELALDFDLPKILLNYRTLSKLQSTYVDKLPKTINLKTGRVHTSYHQTVTATGRLSSSDPNLQNIPIRTLEGRKIREAFVARDGYIILAADYSQIELRILAHLSEDPGLIQAFNTEQDIHSITASEIFQVALAEITQDLRRKAKAINFGLIYGMSDFGLAKQLKISKSEAAAYIKAYFSKFPKVLQFMELTREFAAKHGFVETMFGRRLYLPDIRSNNRIKRQAAERAAINAPMQGGQADLIKLAMIKLDHWLQSEAKDIFMLLQVHDELIFEVPDYMVKSKAKESINVNSSNNNLDLVSNNIRNLMEGVAKLKVALKVEIGMGDSWGEAH